MDAVEHAIARPLPEVIINRRTERKAFWQLPPLAAGAQLSGKPKRYQRHSPSPFRALPEKCYAISDKKRDQAKNRERFPIRMKREPL
jgi:hypothetical protein